MSLSEEQDTTSSQAGSLPPPPVQLTPPARSAIIEAVDDNETAWYHGKFGGNVFGFFGDGRLGITDFAVILSGRNFPPKISRFIHLPFVIMFGIVNIPLNLSIRHLPVVMQYVVMLLFALGISLLGIAFTFTIRKSISQSIDMALDRFKLKRVGHKRNRLIFTAQNEKGKPGLCIFKLPTQEEAETLAAELAKTAED